MFGREEIKGTNEQKHGFRLEGSGGGEGGAEKEAGALRREKMEVVKGKGKKIAQLVCKRSLSRC